MTVQTAEIHKVFIIYHCYIFSSYFNENVIDFGYYYNYNNNN